MTRHTAVPLLVAPVVLLAVGTAFHFALPVVAPGVQQQFNNAALFRPWAGWTSIYMAVHPLWFGPVFAAGYLVLRARGGVPPGWGGGLAYGAAVFAVGGFPIYMLALASFQVSPAVIACWVVQGACQYTAAGAAVGRAAGRVAPGPVRGGGSRAA